ncbi:glycosyltransferase [Persicimonas caeni]|uniref:Glycosyltransferase n=1 Tax=Persicimonas caeni TaxID=2292766 RepID=A0A4Y6PSE8_PERCE|nr:glycosyltransferase family 2 protein [Persicimonas caeni]QDG51228.1 glycosyltransferase [Persicimonas caeni]QED32449.1 glycosyltransferase [Persicimonas caeni]
MIETLLSWETLIWAAGAGLPLFALLMTLFNLVTWPRGRRGSRFTGRLSVLIPARNEEETIEQCVRAALEGTHPVDEVLVYDDQSTDETPAILARLCEEYDQLRVVEAKKLPPDWVGKPHACHRLAEAATGDVLVFVDADTFLQDDGLARIASLFERVDAELVTAVPRQQTASFAERLVLPLLHLTYTSWFPLMLVYRTQDPRFLAANGQLLAVNRATYDDIGGFEAVRCDVVDDMAFCRLAKEAGHRVVFADGFEMASCRMYESAREVWEGFSKNLYEGIGGHPVALLGVCVVYFTAFVLPYVMLATALLGGFAWMFWPAAVGVGANVALRAALAWRFRQPVEGIVLHPVGALALLSIAFNSFRWHASDSIMWSGRTYARKSRRSET